MATRDNHTTQVVQSATDGVLAIVGNTTTNGEVIDTAHFDMGVKISWNVSGYVDGTYTIVYQHADADDLSDATIVTPEYIIGQPLVFTANTSITDWPSNGLHSTKRYVFAQIVSTGVTTGASIQAVAVLDSETKSF